MRIIGCLVLALGFLAPAALGRDIYVSNTAGDDISTGQQAQSTGDRTGPVRTIAKALRLAQAGDRIVLANTDQPYRESISLVGRRHSGLPRQMFTLDGNGATLDGSAPVPAEAWQASGGMVFSFRPRHPGPQQLFLDARPATRVAADEQADSPAELKPLEWCQHRGRVYFCVQPTKLPTDYKLTYASLPTGITLFHVDGVAVVNLTVQGFRLDGISAYNSARNVYLGGVRCRGNGRSGIAVGGASTVEIAASVVGNNGQAQVLTLPHSDVTVRGSDLFSNTAPAWVDQGGRMFLDGKPVQGGIDGRDVLGGEKARE